MTARFWRQWKFWELRELQLRWREAGLGRPWACGGSLWLGVVVGKAHKPFGRRRGQEESLAPTVTGG